MSKQEETKNDETKPTRDASGNEKSIDDALMEIKENRLNFIGLGFGNRRNSSWKSY
jgi:hypothetical protein